MGATGSVEQMTTRIAQMDKDELKQQIKAFPGRFRLDFSDDYLNTAPVDHLRHILLAAALSAGSGPN